MMGTVKSPIGNIGPVKLGIVLGIAYHIWDTEVEQH
jgi:hypothetical protein